MRKFLFSWGALGLVVLFSGVFLGCGSDTDSPEGVAVAFTEAVANFDFEEAGEYATDESRTAMEFLDSIYSELSEEELEQELANVPETPSVVGSEIDGDRAIVTLEDEEGVQETMNLVRVDEKWLVEFEK